MKYLGPGFEMVGSPGRLIIGSSFPRFFLVFGVFTRPLVFLMERGGLDVLGTFRFVVESFSELGAIEYSTDAGPGAALAFFKSGVSSLRQRELSLLSELS